MEDKQEYDYSELAANLVKGLDYFQSSEWQAVTENYRKMMANIGNAVKQIYESEAMQAIGCLAKQIHEFSISLPKIELDETTINNIRKLRYLKYLEEIEWPLYLLIDDDLMSLLEPFVDDAEPDYEELKNCILDFLNNDYVFQLVMKWKESRVINAARVAALDEATELYMKEYYYGCTTLLACQFEGIISDIYSMQMSAGRIFTLEDLRVAYEHYNPEKKLNGSLPMNREKNQLLAMVSETDSGLFYWIAVVGYLYKIILTSDEEMNQSTHPCRNKICHGIQLNYGTREHAVKAILMIDMIIKLGEEMKRILEEE